MQGKTQPWTSQIYTITSRPHVQWWYKTSNEISADQQKNQNQQNAPVNKTESKYSQNKFSFQFLHLTKPFGFAREH